MATFRQLPLGEIGAPPLFSLSSSARNAFRKITFLRRNDKHFSSEEHFPSALGARLRFSFNMSMFLKIALSAFFHIQLVGLVLHR